MLEAEEGNWRMAEKASKRKGGRASKWDKCTCEWESVEGTCFRDKAWLQPMLGSDLLCSKTPSTRALTRARIIIEKISILISRYRSHMSPLFYLKYLHTWPVRTAYLPWLALQLGFRFGLIFTFRFSINNNNVIKIIYISSSLFQFFSHQLLGSGYWINNNVFFFPFHYSWTKPVSSWVVVPPTHKGPVEH